MNPEQKDDAITTRVGINGGHHRRVYTGVTIEEAAKLYAREYLMPRGLNEVDLIVERPERSWELTVKRTQTFTVTGLRNDES